jgi:hypothetical protein
MVCHWSKYSKEKSLARIKAKQRKSNRATIRQGECFVIYIYYNQPGFFLKILKDDCRHVVRSFFDLRKDDYIIRFLKDSVDHLNCQLLIYVVSITAILYTCLDRVAHRSNPLTTSFPDLLNTQIRT